MIFKDYYFIPAACVRLQMENDGKFKLFMEDGAQIFDDADITAPEVVNGRTLTLAENLIILPQVEPGPAATGATKIGKLHGASSRS